MLSEDVHRTAMLALAAWKEARGESWLGKLAVCQTIENRVADSRWPGSYEGVILQPKQFSAFNPGDPNQDEWPELTDASYLDCLDAARLVLEDPHDFAEGANHYHALYIQPPDWAVNKKPVLTLGNHVFYKL